MSDLSIAYIGHATTLIRIGGLNILTDPNYSRRDFIFPRVIPPGFAFEQFPPIDVILISHAHGDHLDLSTLRRFPCSTPIVLPTGLRALLYKLNFVQVVELKHYAFYNQGGINIRAYPGNHKNGKWFHRFNLLFDGYPTCGYLLQSMKATLYFAGDTGYSSVFKEIGRQCRIDVAVLPIGPVRYRPFLRGVHMNGFDALKAFQDLGARYLIPIHWGTFKIPFEPIDLPLILLKEAATKVDLQDRVIVLRPGERWDMARGSKVEC